MKQNLKTRESGFTLIEVLVVVIIVAILAAVAFPIYQNYVKGAYASDAQSAIGSIYNAAQMYYQDMGEWPTDVRGDLEPKYISIKEATHSQWEFTMVGGGEDLTQVNAMSKEGMKQGAGKEVRYMVATGKFEGYGFEDE